MAEVLTLSVRAISRYSERTAAAVVVLATTDFQVLQTVDSCMNEVWDEEMILG